MPTYVDPTITHPNGESSEIDLPQQWYPADTIRGDYVPAGFFTDWQNDTVRSLVFRLRTQVAPRPRHQDIAAQYGFQHWIHSYRAQDCEARRIQRELARGNAAHAGRRDHRSYARAQRNMRTNTGAAPARPGARHDGSLVVRRFGIEIEFNSTDSYTVRPAVVRALVAQGIRSEMESYNHTTRPHWKMTTDATVTGGELVSPILAGDTASLDEVRDVLRVLKDNGATTTARVGMHVHHDVTDFTNAFDRERLIDTLATTERALGAYVVAARTSPSAPCGATYATASEWARIRSEAANTIPGSNARGHNDSGSVSRYRFYNVVGPLAKYGTVEFRGLGGTLHAGKVRVWVRMGQAIIEHARQGHTMPSTAATPEGLVAELRAHNLIGATTGDRFLSEVNRRRTGA